MGKYSKRWEALKPRRPKRAPGKYARFISDYYATHKVPGNPKQTLQNASQAWRNLDDLAQMQFHNQGAIDRYKRELAAYKARKEAMKSPPASYALFVKEYWQQNQPDIRGNLMQRKRKFARVQREISADWNAKSDEEKAVYEKASKMWVAMFEREQESVIRRKRALNLNWRNEAVAQVAKLIKTRRVQQGGGNNDNNEDAE